MSIPRQFSLKYGDKSVTLFLPDEYQSQSLHPAVPPLHLAEEDILKIRLKNPLATPGLEEILKTDDRVLIVVPDKTRVSRLDLVFPYLFQVLQKKKIADEQVTILFANGSHAPMTEAEKHAILGEAAFRRFAHYEHNCREAMVEKLGTTSRGTPVMVNRLITKNSKLIVISSVVHHYFAGFGGGPKMIVPGLAAYDTIWNNHRLAVLAEDSPLHPGCEPGNINKNPVYEDIVEAVQMTRVDFAIQLVLDENYRLVDAFCGDLYSSFQKAGMRVHQLNSVRITKPADLVIASAGGYPKDINLIQAHKAIHHAVRALKPNGILIILAECRNGWGNVEFPVWFEIGNYAEIKKAVLAHFRINSNTALVLKHKLENYQIFLISQLPTDITSKMGFQPAVDLSTALDKAKQLLPSDAVTYVIPNASITLPVLA